MTDLPVENITVPYEELEHVVLPRLRGMVFHVTSASAFAKIKAAGVIRSNPDGELPSTFPSRASFGRQRGYVCLFDLRDVSEDHLQDALMKCYFLNPNRDTDNPVFLFLKESEYSRLLPWTVAVGTSEMYVPYVESWYPSDLPVSALARALVVNVQREESELGIIHRLMREIREASSPDPGASD